MLSTMMIASGMTVSYADPVNINVTGNVVASPCTVDSASGIAVALGDIQATALATAGTTANPKDFDLKLTDCPAGTTSVVVYFSGTADATKTDSYANTGTAKNVSVELIQISSGNLKGNNSNITQSVDADHSVIYKLRAQAYATGVAEPGTISSVIQATFTYQ